MTPPGSQVREWLSAFLAGRLDFAQVEERCATALAEGRFDAAAYRRALSPGAGGPADRLPPHLRMALIRIAPDPANATGTGAGETGDEDATVPRAPAPDKPLAGPPPQAQLPPADDGPWPVRPETPAQSGAQDAIGPDPSGSLPRLADTDADTDTDGPAPDAAIDARVDAAAVDDLLGGFQDVRRAKRAGTARGHDPGIDRQLDEMLQGWRAHRDRAQARQPATDRAAQAALSPGQTLDRLAAGTMLAGRYVLDAELGRGGSGRVYRAIDRRRLEAGDPQPQLALKALAVNVRQNPNAYRRLAQEVHRTQTLAHPHIIQIRDLDRDGDIAFLTMELLEGAPLDAALQDGPVGWETLRAWLAQIGAALRFAHEESIVHADIKPANIFAPHPDGRGRQRLRLLDFGIARSVAEAAGDAHSAGHTPAYASPAVLAGGAPDFADDIFALGVTIAELASGIHPFHGGTVTAPNGPPPTQPDGVPPGAWRAVTAAMAPAPADRPESIDELLNALGL